MNEHEMRQHIRKMICEKYGTIRKAAKPMGVCYYSLYRFTNGTAREIPAWLLNWAGIERTTTYSVAPVK